MSKRQAVKAISLLWLGSLLGAGFAFLTQVILARQLGPSEFGVFASALATVTILAPLAGFGVAQYWLKAFGEEGWGAMRWLPPSFRFIGVSTVIVITVLMVWGLYGPHEQSAGRVIIVLSSYVLGQVSVELVSSKLQLEEHYVNLAAWQLTSQLARFLLVVILSFGLTGWMSGLNVAVAYAVVSGVIALLGCIHLVRMARGNFRLKGHSQPVSALDAGGGGGELPRVMMLVSQAWPFGLSMMFYFIYYQSSIVLIKYLVGPKEAGIYNVACAVMAAVYLFPGVLYQKFLIPKIHRWANHDRERFYQVYRQGNKVMLALGTGAMLSIWLLSSWAILLLFGKQYSEAIVLLNTLAVSAPIIFTAASVGATLVTGEYMRKKVKYQGGIAVLNVFLNLILIPVLGSLGAAISSVISNACLLVVYYISTQRLVFKSAQSLS
ncbi:MAG: oligosaccharide flippase family protein [Gammaproteobacteria bacterium]|nr:oligosaccharide flippase family protein [Gammaproteobacteria bacterium]